MGVGETLKKNNIFFSRGWGGGGAFYFLPRRKSLLFLLAGRLAACWTSASVQATVQALQLTWHRAPPLFRFPWVLKGEATGKPHLEMKSNIKMGRGNKHHQGHK